jgi:hypothetical protein
VVTAVGTGILLTLVGAAVGAVGLSLLAVGYYRAIDPNAFKYDAGIGYLFLGTFPIGGVVGGLLGAILSIWMSGDYHAHRE